MKRTPDRNENGTWLMTVDRRSARLLHGSTTAHGRLHVDALDALEEDWNEFEHGRPSPRAGKDAHSYASPGHEAEERLHRFAKRVAGFLESSLAEHHVERLHVFSSRRLLGDLRRVLPRRLDGRLDLRPLDIAHLKPNELATHEAVVAAHQADRERAADGPHGPQGPRSSGANGRA